uniref:Uncharacterized protein n=1 Tax=Hordeum vulgare subsp. vulgare TaxID=112509 RepID=A0A8I6WJK6_HORVV
MRVMITHWHVGPPGPHAGVTSARAASTSVGLGYSTLPYRHQEMARTSSSSYNELGSRRPPWPIKPPRASLTHSSLGRPHFTGPSIAFHRAS